MSRSTYSIHRIIDLVEYLVDRNVGVIRFLLEMPREPGAPDFFHYSAMAGNTRAFTRQTNFNNTGGASINRMRAMAKAMGEAVERYCSAIYDLEEFPVHSYAEAPYACTHPSEFVLYGESQYADPSFRYQRFTEESPVRWAPMLDLKRDEIVHVPASMIYMPYTFYETTGETPAAQPISTGMACHCSLAESALSGIYEVIERDAFLITWQAMLAPPQVIIETVDDEHYEMIQRFERCHSRITVFDITLDHAAPTLLSVQESLHPDGPALAFAAATDLNPRKALSKSLEELAHTRRYCQDIKNGLPRLQPNPDFSNVVDQMTHLNLYADHEQKHLADFIFRSEKRIEFDEIEDRSTGDPEFDLANLTDAIDAMGHRVLLCDMTTADVRDLGLFATRALIPGFHPLFMGYTQRALGGERLWTIPQRLGYAGVTPETGDNPAPHPYP